MQDISYNKRFEYNWDVPFKVTLGESYFRFLDGLKNKKILGNICPKCNGLHVPARPFCDKCLVEITKWYETSGIVTIESFSVTYVKFLGLPDPPHITGIVRAENAVTSFLHQIGGIPYDEPKELDEKTKIGMKLKPVWAEKRIGDIQDILYFTPVDA